MEEKTQNPNVEPAKEMTEAELSELLQMDGAAFDRSDEEITYMDTKDNVIYLAGGCFWGIHDLIDGVFLIRADPEQQVHLQRLHKIRFQPCALIRFVLRV